VFRAEVHCHIIVLVAIAGIEEDGFVDVSNVNPGLKSLSGVAVSSVCFGDEFNVFAGDEVVYHMSPPISESARIYAI